MKSFFCKTLLAIFYLAILACLVTSCNNKINEHIRKPQNETRYRTGYPVLNASADLNNIVLSTKKVKNYSTYRTYVFDENTKVTLKDLNSDRLLEHTRAGIVTNDATLGTALVIFSNGKNVALLTCAHAVKAPDTIVQWAEYSDLDNNRYIHSISLKIRQQLYVNEMPMGTKFQVLAFDQKNDIALLGTIYNDPVNEIPVFKYPCGNSADLRWGSFLYIAGYPTGQQMVTHGIVSTLPEKSGNFLTDAPFNEGLSGGIVLAITEVGGNFELVGIARSVSATYGYTLKPEKEIHEFTYNPALPYSGNVYVNQKKDINYGVTSIISINQIIQFYEEHRNALIEAGFNLDEFFGLENMK